MVGKLKVVKKWKNSVSFKCDLCDKRFTQSGSLTKHKQSHTGAKQINCNLCEKIFTQSGNLTTHIQSHAGAKPFKYNLCEKWFTQSCNLTSHKWIHTNKATQMWLVWKGIYLIW